MKPTFSGGLMESCSWRGDMDWRFLEMEAMEGVFSLFTGGPPELI